VNDRWAEIVGAVSARSSASDAWLDCIHADDRRSAREAWIECLHSSRAGSLSVRMSQPQGDPRSMNLTVSPLPAENGAGFLVMLAEAPGSLENEADALHARKMEAVGRLASGLAHDFANLITLISGYSEIVLSRMGADDALRAEVDEIRKAAKHGSGLTRQLLTFARRHAVEPQVLDLNALVAGMQKMLPRMIGEHIDVVTHLAADLGSVKADPGQLEQVIMNLAINARDAMPRGGQIVIRTRNIDVGPQPERAALRPGPYVMLQFHDTGYGMDRDTLDHLFEPFFTTKEKGKGTGLGLATVYAIVQQSAGDLCVQSDQGKGTTVTICLPRVDDKIKPAEDISPAATAAGGTETILLVEDEEGVRRLLKHVLAKQGYTVIEAANGPEALAVFRELRRPVELLLTDIVMPRMSGRELAERLLRLQPGLKVMYMSGYMNEALVGTGTLGAGAKFLPKPLRPELLAAAVRELLDSPAAGDGQVAHLVSSDT
jgi:two-component system, cell cycle sensor histidine kinase and response regulator CckA